MDSSTTQQMGFSPYTAPPCPGCASGATPGQTRAPLQGTAPITPPRPDLLSQMPTGMPTGPYYGTGPMPGQTLQQQGTMPQQGMVPQQGFPMQTPGMLPGPSQDLAPITPWNQPQPVTTESLQYMNGFMRTQIGRRVTIEFLIGTNTLVDKTGTLLAVGANYVLINEVESDDILMCDFYSIKFIKFYY